MPSILVRVNIKLTDEQKNALLKKLTQTIRQILGKPVGYILSQLSDNFPMQFGGTNDPCAFIDLRSISCIDKENKITSAALTKLFEEYKIPSKRIYIKNQDKKRYTGYFKRIYMEIAELKNIIEKIIWR